MKYNALHQSFTFLGTLCPLVISAMLFTSAMTVRGQSPCDCPTVRLDDAFCYADLVFEGYPLMMDTVHEQGGIENAHDDMIDHIAVRFQVDRVLKGHAPVIQDIASDPSGDECAFHFIPGMKYIVFAAMEEGVLTTDRCTPNRNIDTVSREFADSLQYVMDGNSWNRAVPVEVPCR